jgi:hypothetical protein
MVQHDHEASGAAPLGPAPMPALTPQGASRRRIAGLGVSGVLMTVASSHAMADLVCKSPSGDLSGDLNSRTPKETCAGQSPEYWAANLPKGITKHTRFSQIFPTSDAVGNMTVIKVLEGRGNQGIAHVPALMLATYFNVTASPPLITFLTEQAVKDMWANYDGDHLYRPNLSESWDSARFAEYLSSTQLPYRK